MIPLAPGPGSLVPMSWAWLTGTPVLFIVFIATLIGIPVSVAAIVQLVRPVVHHTMSRHAETPTVKFLPDPDPVNPANLSFVLRRALESASPGPLQASARMWKTYLGTEDPAV